MMKHRIDRFVTIAFVALVLVFVVSLFCRADVAPRDHLRDLSERLVLSQPPKVLPPEDSPLMRRLSGAAIDARRAVADLSNEGVLPALEEEKKKWEAIAYTWGFFESGLQTDPIGSNDFGTACGVMQLHALETPPSWLGSDAGKTPKETCARARKDRVYGFRIALRVLARFRAECAKTEVGITPERALRAALTAYSTDGACHAWIASVVTYRCAFARC